MSEQDRILTQMEGLLDDYYRLVEESRIPDGDPRYGVAATRMAAAAGNLVEIEESIRGSVFSDFLDMAAHFLEEYDLPAATSAGILAGATLEEYLRKLADAYGIATAKSGGEPVQAESVNTELGGEGVYDLSEQMQVTAWLDDLMIRHPA